MNDDTLAGRRITARLDRINLWPYPKKYMIIVGIGFFFSFYDILTIGLALPKIQQDFIIDLHQATWTITSSLIGYILGSFFISRLADKHGRKLGLTLSMLFFFLGSFGSAISVNLTWLIISQLITGIGIGAEIANITAYIGELAPASVRGRSTSIAIAYGMLGFAIIPFVAYFLIPHYAYGWRILFAIGGLGGILIYLLRRVLPDSPRWLVINHRLDQAEKIVAQVEQFAQKKSPAILPKPKMIATYAMNHDTSLKNFLDKKYIFRIILFTLIWFIYYIGNYAWLTLVPSLLVKHGFSITTSIGFTAVASTGFVLGSIISVFIVDKLERKWLAVIISLIWSVILLLIGWFAQPFLIMVVVSLQPPPSQQLYRSYIFIQGKISLPGCELPVYRLPMGSVILAVPSVVKLFFLLQP